MPKMGYLGSQSEGLRGPEMVPNGVHRGGLDPQWWVPKLGPQTHWYLTPEMASKGSNLGSKRVYLGS